MKFNKAYLYAVNDAWIRAITIDNLLNFNLVYMFWERIKVYFKIKTFACI
jgi:hypothetical protein